MLLDDICAHLSTQVSGLTIGTNLWKIPIPETASSSDIQVGVVEYGGRAPLRAMGPSLGAPTAEIARFNVAVIGPNARFADTRDMAQDIYEALDNLADTTLGSTKYLLVRALQPPINYELPDDENAQFHFSVNFEALKARG